MILTWPRGRRSHESAALAHATTPAAMVASGARSIGWSRCSTPSSASLSSTRRAPANAWALATSSETIQAGLPQRRSPQEHSSSTGLARPRGCSAAGALDAANSSWRGTLAPDALGTQQMWQAGAGHRAHARGWSLGMARRPKRFSPSMQSGVAGCLNALRWHVRCRRPAPGSLSSCRRTGFRSPRHATLAVGGPLGPMPMRGHCSCAASLRVSDPRLNPELEPCRRLRQRSCERRRDTSG